MVIAFESVLAILTVLLLYPPMGQLSIFACAVDSLVDFYPMFWDSASQDEGDHTRDCIYEAAFPRTTLVLSYLGLSLVLVLFVRFPLTLLCWRKHPHNNSLCYGLVIVPTVAALFVASSGPLYYSFEYISLAIGAIGLAVEAVYVQWKLNTANPLRIYCSLIHWLAFVIFVLFLYFGVVGLEFYPYHYYLLIPMSAVSVVLYPMFFLCVHSHPYTRIWHLKKRQRNTVTNVQGRGEHRWLRGARIRNETNDSFFPPEIDTSGSSSSDSAMLY